jgi:hypothetical protein
MPLREASRRDVRARRFRAHCAMTPPVWSGPWQRIGKRGGTAGPGRGGTCGGVSCLIRSDTAGACREGTSGEVQCLSSGAAGAAPKGPRDVRPDGRSGCEERAHFTAPFTGCSEAESNDGAACLKKSCHGPADRAVSHSVGCPQSALGAGTPKRQQQPCTRRARGHFHFHLAP